MALDLSTIDPQARIALIEDGECFSSEDTLDQANFTLNSLALHAAELIKKIDTAAYASAMSDAQRIRLRVRSVLQGARRDFAFV